MSIEGEKMFIIFLSKFYVGKHLLKRIDFKGKLIIIMQCVFVFIFFMILIHKIILHNRTNKMQQVF